jgi:hypothetical protein
MVFLVHAISRELSVMSDGVLNFLILSVFILFFSINVLDTLMVFLVHAISREVNVLSDSVLSSCNIYRN